MKYVRRLFGTAPSLPEVWVCKYRSTGETNQCKAIAEALTDDAHIKVVEEKNTREGFKDHKPDVFIFSGTTPLSFNPSTIPQTKRPYFIQVSVADNDVNPNSEKWVDYHLVYHSQPNADYLSDQSEIYRKKYTMPSLVTPQRMKDDFGLIQNSDKLKPPVIFASIGDLDQANAEALCKLLKENKGGSLLVSTSGRTRPNITSYLKEQLSDICVDFYDYRGNPGRKNPYMGFLGAATKIVCTADSLAQPCDAFATGKPVHLYIPVKNLTSSGVREPLADVQSEHAMCGVANDNAKYFSQWRGLGLWHPISELDKEIANKKPTNSAKEVADEVLLFLTGRGKKFASQLDSKSFER